MAKGNGGKLSLRDKRSAAVKLPKKKKKVYDDEEAPRKKKKKKQPGTEMVLHSGTEAALAKVSDKKVRMTKKKLKKILKIRQSEFKEDIADISAILDEEDLSVDRLKKAVLTAELRAVLHMIPIMENEARQNKKESNAYAFNSILSQSQSIMDSLQALQDSEQVAFRISTNIINPAFLAIINTIGGAMAQLREHMDEFVPADKRPRMRLRFVETGRLIGGYLGDTRDAMAKAIAEQIE